MVSVFIDDNGVDKNNLLRYGRPLLECIAYISRLLEDMGYISVEELSLILSGIYVLERRRRYSYKELRRLIEGGWRILAPVGWRRARYMARRLEEMTGYRIAVRKISTAGGGEGYLLEKI